MFRKLSYFLCACFLLFLSNCRCQDEKIHLKNIVFELPKILYESKSIDSDKFLAVIRTAVENDNHYVFNETDNEGGNARFSLHLPGDADKTKAILLSAVLSLPKNEAKEFKSFATIAVASGAIASQEVDAALHKLLDNLYLTVYGKKESVEKLRERLSQALSSQALPQDELLHTIVALEELNDADSVPLLLRLLSSTTDMAVGNACMLALSHMKVAEAMPLIIDFVERKPAVMRRQGIIAAKHIATKQAAEWLLVMAYGHDDLTVRKEALAALKEVEAKLAQKPDAL